jgi:hypothetical protein
MNVLINLTVEMIFSQCIAEIIFQNQRDVSDIKLSFMLRYVKLMSVMLRYVKLKFMKPNKFWASYMNLQSMFNKSTSCLEHLVASTAHRLATSKCGFKVITCSNIYLIFLLMNWKIKPTKIIVISINTTLKTHIILLYTAKLLLLLRPANLFYVTVVNAWPMFYINYYSETILSRNRLLYINYYSEALSLGLLVNKF